MSDAPEESLDDAGAGREAATPSSESPSIPDERQRETESLDRGGKAGGGQRASGHSRFRRTSARLTGGLWFGSGAFLLAVAAPAAFRASDSPTNAANIVGAMLTTWHYLGLALPLALLLLEWRRARTSMIVVVFAAIMMASAGAVIDLNIRAIRAESPIPISSLAKSDPVRHHFGILHGISSLLLLGQILAAAAAVAVDTER